MRLNLASINFDQFRCRLKRRKKNFGWAHRIERIVSENESFYRFLW